MRLFHSPTSPYVRKVMACAIATGLDGQLTLIPTNPHESGAELLEANPLSLVPCLVTEDGLSLYDSPVICEYLDGISQGIPLFPSKGAARWRALKLQAMGDGILDAAVARRGDAARPQEAVRDGLMARRAAAVRRTLDALEAEPPAAHLDIGSIAVACALGYLDFRFEHEPWRKEHPHLASWFAGIATQECIARTAPKG